MNNKQTKTTIPMVSAWVRKDPSKAYAYQDGQNVRLNLKKFVPKSSKRILEELDSIELSSAESLIIERKLFVHKTDVLAHYIDYYTEFYDPDKELITGLFHIKKSVDLRTEPMKYEEFIELLTRTFFRDTDIRSQVYQLVEHNYHLDVTTDKESGRKFVDHYDFTNNDAKALLAISTIMKFAIPVISHYIETNKVYSGDTLNSLVIDVFMEIFVRVGEYEDTNPDILLMKLYTFTDKNVMKHANYHKALWVQQGALRGLTESKHVDTILIKHLIGNNMFKLQFDDSIVSFMKSIVETQLTCTINRLKYKADPIRVDGVKDVNGLSGIDKLEQSLAKVDETTIIRCEKSLDDAIMGLEREYGVVKEDEISFYGVNCIVSSSFHSMLLGYAFAKEFDGYTELKNMNIQQHMKLVVLAKRKLISQGYKQLPWLFSSVIRGKTSMRLLQNSKFINKLTTSSVYQNLIKNKYPVLAGYKEDTILSIISQVLNNIYTYVEYDKPELLDEIIEFDEDIIGDELLNFIDNI